MVSFLTSPHPKLQQLPSRFIKTDCRIIANLLWSVETSPPEQTISFNHKPLPNPSSSDWPCILLRFWEPDSGRGITQEPINLLMFFQTRTVAAFARRTCTTQLPGAKAVIISRTRRSCFFETHLRHGFVYPLASRLPTRSRSQPNQAFPTPLGSGDSSAKRFLEPYKPPVKSLTIPRGGVQSREFVKKNRPWRGVSRHLTAFPHGPTA